jgi:hypothetical protein
MMRIDQRGQAALVLILLAALGLIFLAITLNWGSTAQVKTLVTVAADNGAALLGSDAASYGQMQKQTNLKDTNQVSGLSGFLLDLITLIVAIVVLICAILFPPGGAWGAMAIFNVIAAAVAVGAAVATLTLQVLVIQPGITALWNKLQKDQPIEQQFFEGGVGAALSAVVTDQAKVGDYFDLNVNGIFGTTGNIPNDTVSRFALFYTDRLKMLNGTGIPQLTFFYNQLAGFMQGQTCLQNYTDNQNDSFIPLNPTCFDPNNGQDYCAVDPADPNCQAKIPNTITCAYNAYLNKVNPSIPLDRNCPIDCNPYPPADIKCQLLVPNPMSFQLTDPCTDSDPFNASYNPYCDPCCVAKPGGTCNPAEYPPAPAAGVQCLTNNPYTLYGSYPYLYDPTFQEYANQVSFLDKFGRDQQMMVPLGSSQPVNNMTVLANFPSGIYPFFWLMTDYSPQVDNLNPSSMTPTQYHWCVAGGAVPPVTSPSLTLFPDLNQLTLPYGCIGADCCVNYLPDTLVGGVPGSDGSPTGTTNGAIDMFDSTAFPGNLPNPALTSTFGEGGKGTWLPVDNQMCLATSPYDGATGAFPDGTCEWTGGGGAILPPTLNALGSVDAVDDTMHTMADFSKYAQSLLNKGLPALTSTFSSWYPQLANWVEPATGSCGSPTCCSSQTDGRLLSIYNPNGSVDVLKDWNTLITNWLLNNSYTPPGSDSTKLWCVPSQGQLPGNNEGSFIFANAPTPTWGDLLHVIACMNYNAGPTSAQLSFYSRYQTCLNALPSGPSCPAALPAACTQAVLNYPNNISPPPPAYNGGPNASGCNVWIDGSFAWWVSSIFNFGPVYNYQNCMTLLQAPLANGGCPAMLAGTVCQPGILGRSLTTSWTGSYSGGVAGAPSCDPTSAGSFAQWVQNNLTLFTDENPKFAKRLAYLTDVYGRTQTLLSLTTQGDWALQNFFKPCGGAPNCGDGGPAAQLNFACNNPPKTGKLPNAVIYGWVDKTLPNGQNLPGSLPQAGGYAHIVKVTAFAPGRGGSAPFIQPKLAWIHSSSSLFTQTYTLTNRDGNVYVSVQRWDQPHTIAPVTFPNGHLLWQFMIGNSASAGANPLAGCRASNGFGYGLTDQTVAGLNFNNQISVVDQGLLANAFMLNDNGDGTVDPAGKTDPNYSSCQSQAEILLASGVESHSCARYVASSGSDAFGANGFSKNDDQDYTLEFVDCNAIDGGSPPQSLP